MQLIYVLLFLLGLNRNICRFLKAARYETHIGHSLVVYIDQTRCLFCRIAAI